MKRQKCPRVGNLGSCKSVTANTKLATAVSRLFRIFHQTIIRFAHYNYHWASGITVHPLYPPSIVLCATRVRRKMLFYSVTSYFHRHDISPRERVHVQGTCSRSYRQSRRRPTKPPRQLHLQIHALSRLATCPSPTAIFSLSPFLTDEDKHCSVSRNNTHQDFFLESSRNFLTRFYEFTK